MDKGLFFMVLAFLGVWLIVDEFIGQKRISSFVSMIVGDISE